MKIGDTVRFLNSVGGGKITKIQGQLAYVDDNGFETPVLMKELVVVLPAGHEAEVKGPVKMFDQKAFDDGKKIAKPIREEQPAVAEKELEPELPVEETAHGDKMNIVLAFEPSDVRNLDKSKFAAVLVNDSNYFLNFTFLRRSAEERGWSLVFNGVVAPNELIDLASLTHEILPQYDRIAFQCVAYKKDKLFTLQAPISVSRKLDLTKFHKFHCFRAGLYFDNAVLEVPIVTDGVATKPLEVNAAELKESMSSPNINKEVAGELSKKFKVDAGKKKKLQDPAANPHKVLPLIEVDLHIGELTDTLAGMEPKDMLELQLATVRKHMKAHNSRIGQKLVFIHGKGEGVLRKAVMELLRKEYPKAELQDASFREYGFGATLVTIH